MTTCTGGSKSKGSFVFIYFHYRYDEHGFTFEISQDFSIDLSIGTKQVACSRHTAWYTRLAYNGYLDLECIFCNDSEDQS